MKFIKNILKSPSFWIGGAAGLGLSILLMSCAFGQMTLFCKPFFVPPLVVVPWVVFRIFFGIPVVLGLLVELVPISVLPYVMFIVGPLNFIIPFVIFGFVGKSVVVLIGKMSRKNGSSQSTKPPEPAW